MKRRDFLLIMPILLLAWFFVGVNFTWAEGEVSWILKSSMPTARSGPATGMIDGKIYVAGGSNSSGQALANLEAYDPAMDSWEIKPAMSAPRWGLASGILDGKYYVIVGGSPTPSGTTKTEEFDPETEQWTQKSDMPNPGWGVAAGVINNKLYVVGGYNWSNKGMAWNRQYDPTTNQWTMKASMPTRRSWLGAEVIDNKLYVVGGWNQNDTIDLPTLEVYDPASDSWTAKANMPVGLRNIATATLDGKLYVFGGLTGEGSSTKFYSSIYVYDPSTDAWSRPGDLPQAIAGGAAEAVNGNIYLFGGSNSAGGLNTTYFWQLEKEINPVILVPGILGSWNISGRWQIDPIFHTYDNLMEALIAAGYREDGAMEDVPNLFTFPYDWRADNNITAELLKDKIQQVKNITGASRVDLVAHSMGGLVARSYIQSDNYQNDVDQIIFLGTPHKGSLESYLKYEGGTFTEKWDFLMKYLFQIEATANGYLDLVDYIRAQVLSVEQLLPIYDYLKNKQSDNSWPLRPYPLNYPQNNYLENLNSDEAINLLKQRVNIVNMVGNLGSESTLNYIKVVDDPDAADNKWQSGYPEGLDEDLRGLEMGGGDSTVPLMSADSLSGVEVIEANEASHAGLPTVMQKEIVETLTGRIPENYYNNKITTTVKRWLLFRVYSPVDFTIVAPSGKRIGKDFLNNAEINEISDAFYSGFNGEAEFVLIPNPEDGEYRVEVQGVDDGGEYVLAGSYINEAEENSVEYSGAVNSGEENNFTIDYSAQEENPISDFEPIDTTAAVITINKPTQDEQYLHNDDLIIDYALTDDFSGVATSTIIIDGQSVATTTIDLFNYALGGHNLTITAIDQAGNQSQMEIKFEIIASIDSTISDVEEIYNHGWLKEKTYLKLLREASQLLRTDDKYFNREERLTQQLIKLTEDDNKLDSKHKQRLIEKYNKQLEKLKELRTKAIVRNLNSIVKLIKRAISQDKINQQGYDIIIDDVEYLRKIYN